MGITSWFPEREVLGSSGDYPRLSSIGIQIFLCVGGRFWDSLWLGVGWASEVASSVGNPDFRCVNVLLHYFEFYFAYCCCYWLLSFSFWAVKTRPKLKSRYREQVRKAIEYVRTIESWDDLVDPRTLAFYCLGPEPSAFVLRNLSIEGKKSKS